MPTRELPSEEWISALDNFSRRHLRWIVDLEIAIPDLAIQKASTRLPLIGISADLKSRRKRIEIAMGLENDVSMMTHIIENPQRVWVSFPIERAHESVEIESEDGTRTLLSFRHIPLEQTEHQLPRETGT
ncbi:MAG TPA: DUF5335 family protein [Terriglobia bacterium]|nr:DUF5335 family protein [Terriglobia bacterium]